MNELEELKKQRMEINKRIKELESKAIRCNKAKLGFQHYSGFRSDDWYIAIETRNECPSDSWKKIIQVSNREDAIELIQDVISDLITLYNMAKEEGGK